jgi:hypothetical protein
VPVRQHHALGHAGRAGRVEDVGEIIVDHWHGLRARAGARHLVEPRRRNTRHRRRVLLADQEHEAGPVIAQRLEQRRGAIGRGDDRTDGAVRGDRRRPHHRRLRVDRHVGGAGSHRAVHGGDGVDPLRRVESDSVASADAGVGERGGDGVGASRQLGVRDRPLARANRRSVGFGPGGAVEQMMQGEHRQPFLLTRRRIRVRGAWR